MSPRPTLLFLNNLSPQATILINATRKKRQQPTMLLAFLVLTSLLPSLSLTEPPRILPRATGSVGPTSGNPTYYCWKHSDSKNNYLHTTNRGDCARALHLIIASDKSNAPMVFSHSPDVGYHVPDLVESGTCIIRFDVSMASIGKDVTSPISAVAGAALHIMDNCLIDQPGFAGLGGRAVVRSRDGSGASIDVVLIGRPPPPVTTQRIPYLRVVPSDTGASPINQA